MNYFWGNVFEYFKERRYAAVFFGTLAGLVAALAAGVVLYQIADAFELLPYWPDALAAIASWLLFMTWRGIQRGRTERRNRYKISPLSRDELAKARSKLMRQR